MMIPYWFGCLYSVVARDIPEGCGSIIVYASIQSKGLFFKFYLIVQLYMYIIVYIKE